MTETASNTDTREPLRLFFSVGDISADLHTANLIREIRNLRPDAVLEGLGGPKMAEAGCDIRYPLTTMNVMWFNHAIRHLRTAVRTQRETLEHFEAHRPDAVVLVDFSGYNLRLARLLRKRSIPVVYYICPQLWASRRGRIRTMRRCVTKALCIWPFEAPIYRDAGVAYEVVGHPLFDHLDQVTIDEDFCTSLRAETRGELIGLLPGSRDQEIKALLPVMAKAAGKMLDELPDALFAISCDTPRHKELIHDILAKYGLPVRVFLRRTFEVMKEADFCMVASGTATLELAHYNTPMIILYRVNPAAYVIARALMHTKQIGLVNILAGREVVPEHLLWRDNPKRVAADALDVITNPERHAEVERALKTLRETLDHPGASRQAADAILRTAEALRGQVPDDGRPSPNR